MSIDKEIVKEFVDESKNLINEGMELLESIEGDFSKVKKLSDYGNVVDRIMGGAKSLALLAPPDHALHLISDYASLCKAVGYKASQIESNQQLFNVCVALLLDGTETLDELIVMIDKTQAELKETIPEAFIERLRWVSDQFAANVSQSVGGGTAAAMSQAEIDALLKKLGM